MAMTAVREETRRRSPRSTMEARTAAMFAFLFFLARRHPPEVAQGSRRPARSGSGRLRARSLNYSGQRQKPGADTQMSLFRGFQVDLESKLILFNDEADHTPVRSKVLGLPHGEGI